MNADDPDQLTQAIAAALQPLHEANMELNARLSAQRFLLEISYGNTYRGDAAGLDKIITELIRLTRTASTRAEPMPDEFAIETQARIAVHLQRFGASVARRIGSGRTI